MIHYLIIPSYYPLFVLAFCLDFVETWVSIPFDCDVKIFGFHFKCLLYAVIVDCYLCCIMIKVKQAHNVSTH